MKRLISKMKQMKLGNKGLTIVELVCAIAIFGVLSATIGGIMVFGARSYQNSTKEVELQRESQLTANQISDLIIDTTSSVSYVESAGATRTLVIQQGNRKYEVTYRVAEQDIVFTEYEVAVGGDVLLGEANQLMASNVVDFEAKGVDKFQQTGSLQLRLKFASGSRGYESWYTISARNGMVEEAEVELTASIITEPSYIIEPNENLELKATVVGPANTAVRWSVANASDESNTYTVVNEGRHYLHAGVNESSDTMQLTVETEETKDGVPLATETIPVNVRRVTGITVDGNPVGANEYVAGAEYKVTAAIAGTNLDRVLGVEYDDVDHYKDPYKVNWTYVLKDEAGNIISNAGDYFEFTSGKEGAISTFGVKLKQDMGDLILTVTATAAHPAGDNKSGIPYNTGIKGSWVLDAPAAPSPLDGKSLDSVKIIPISLEAFNPKYISVVKTTGFTYEEQQTDLTYYWSVDEPHSNCVAEYVGGNTGKTLQLKIHETEENVNKVITIRLRVTSTSLSALAGTPVYVEDAVTYIIPRVGDRGDSYLERGKDGNDNIIITYSNVNEGYEYTNMVGDANTCHEMYLCDEYGNIIENPPLDISQYVSLLTYQKQIFVNIKTGLPSGQDYYIKAIVHLQRYNSEIGGWTTWDYSRVIYIPAVTIVGNYTTTEWNGLYTSYHECVYYNMAGFNINKWKNGFYEVEVVDLQYTAPEGVVVNATFAQTNEKVQSENLMFMGFNFTCVNNSGMPDYQVYNEHTTVVESMTVKISAKDDPNVYDYATVKFTNDR